MKDDIAHEIKARRNQELLRLQEEIQLKNNRCLLGREIEAYVEGPSKRNPNRLTGRTSANRIVHFEGGEELHGRFVRLRVEDSTALSLNAVFCPSP